MEYTSTRKLQNLILAEQIEAEWTGQRYEKDVWLEETGTQMICRSLFRFSTHQP